MTPKTEGMPIEDILEYRLKNHQYGDGVSLTVGWVYEAISTIKELREKVQELEDHIHNLNEMP